MSEPVKFIIIMLITIKVQGGKIKTVVKNGSKVTTTTKTIR